MFSSLPKLITPFENIPAYLVYFESAIQLEADFKSFLANWTFSSSLGYIKKGETFFSTSLGNLWNDLGC